MSKRNTELLERTMQYILDHPEAHDQTTWGCGTVACFAGWACRLAELEQYGNYKDWFVINDAYYHVQQAARYILRLDYREADNLFHCRNTIDDLQRMVKELCNGE